MRERCVAKEHTHIRAYTANSALFVSTNLNSKSLFVTLERTDTEKRLLSGLLFIGCQPNIQKSNAHDKFTRTHTQRERAREEKKVLNTKIA